MPVQKEVTLHEILTVKEKQGLLLKKKALIHCWAVMHTLESSAQLRFLLLDKASHFRDLVHI